MKLAEDPSYPLILRLQSLLEQIPIIEKVKIIGDGPSMDEGVDYLIQVRIDKTTYVTCLRNKKQLASLDLCAQRLKPFGLICMAETEILTPVLLAPYLSADSRQICQENNIAFLDMEGNAQLQFGGVYIDHRMPGKPVPEKRGLRTMFSPKSAQVLRMMLNDPLRTWKVTELSEEGKVSLGHASNVRKNLLEREWAVISSEGLTLNKPGALVNEWRDNYRPIQGKKKNFYTPLHGNALESQLRNLLGCDEVQGSAILASFSAAQWLSPYGRTGMHFFFADEKGMERLISGLKLSTTSKGANVTITVPNDEGIFLDAIEPAPGIVTTGVIQTYLDLTVQGVTGTRSR